MTSPTPRLTRFTAYATQADARPVFRLRATITVDLEVADFSELQQSQAQLEDLRELVSKDFATAHLEIRQRRAPQSRRPIPPRLTMPPYADD